MHLILVAVCAALCFRAFRRRTGSTARAILLTFVALELVATVQIECLSPASAYRLWPVTIFWGLAAIAAHALRGEAPVGGWERASFGRWEWAVGAGCAALLGGTLITALWGAPNTFDALTYHLPRAMHWIENGSIAHYPTSAPRQLKMPPLAEILDSQALLLWGGDRLVNLVQWSASGASAVAIFAIVRGAGLPPIAGLAGALLFLATPTVVLQASGPKNDLVMCANLVAAIAFFRFGHRELEWRWMIAGSAALGLAILTKTTALVFGSWIAFIAFGASIRRYGPKRGLVLGACAALVAIAVNAPHWGRNLRTFGNLVGRSSSGYEPRNDRPDVGALVSNLLRNLAIHMETPSDGLNRRIEAGVAAAHRGLGLRIDDPATTWPGATLDLPRFPSGYEDRSGNPLQLLLIVTALAAAPWALRGSGHWRLALVTACGLVAAAVAFSALLKWQIWHSRLHLPLFVVGCVLVPLVAWRRPRALAVTALLTAVVAVPAVVGNRARPLIGEESVFRVSRFHNLFRRDELGGRRLARRLQELRPGRIGIRLGGEDPEYLIWYAASKASPEIEIEVVDPQFASPPARPRALLVDTVVTYGDDEQGVVLGVEGHRYVLDRRYYRFAVWRLERRPDGEGQYLASDALARGRRLRSNRREGS